MADHDTAKCLVKRCICCSQVQNFSCLDNISCTSELIIILLFLSPELQIVLWPNLVWWCIIISCSVLWKIVLLCSRSRTQWMLRLSLNVYLNKIFWKIETFVAKLGTVMHHHEPVSCTKIVLLSSRSRSLWGPVLSKHTISIFKTADPFATKPSLVVHHHKLTCLVKILDYWV